MSNSQQNATDPLKVLNPILPSEPVETSAGNDTLRPTTSSSVHGEQSVSGDMPDPESDDDTLENVHMMAIALEADDEHPKPLNIARDVAKAEALHRKS